MKKFIIAHQSRFDFKDQDEIRSYFDCDEVRLLIRKVLNRGIVSKGKFSKDIKCSGAAVEVFLSESGPDEGQDSDVFKNALAWFNEKQIIELTISHRQTRWVAPRLEEIHIDGEETNSVAVLDSCDEIRSKITSYLNQTGSPTRNQFCRALRAQLRTTKLGRIDISHIDRFRAKEGPSAGIHSVVYYAAYVYFEKLRIAEGKQKSKHRIEMERRYPHGVNKMFSKKRKILSGRDN